MKDWIFCGLNCIAIPVDCPIFLLIKVKTILVNVYNEDNTDAFIKVVRILMHL